ncbi:hypothetical protein [Streptomyces chattanoogensis]|uniref:hypothetical protein n=1 Tax=Streptomyces chattanoogensis TaxID=66876 RepID=UPI0036C96DCB
MPTRIPDEGTPQPHNTVPARTVWSLLILVLALLGLMGAGILVYVTWRHPSLGTPLGVAFAGVTLLTTVVTSLSRR